MRSGERCIYFEKLIGCPGNHRCIWCRKHTLPGRLRRYWSTNSRQIQTVRSQFSDNESDLDSDRLTDSVCILFQFLRLHAPAPLGYILQSVALVCESKAIAARMMG